MSDEFPYKLKEEVTEYCTSYIDKKFESEKGLIKDYIGLGLKVALGGIGIAVLTAGFFGWKSYDDINKSVQAEIKTRFNNDNPIVKYENLIKESAIEGAIAAMTARINSSRQPFFSDDGLTFLTRMLQDNGISLEKRRQYCNLLRRFRFRASRDNLRAPLES